jgi:two-component system alkaline phosphatase synthesis response regulator PhoP
MSLKILIVEDDLPTLKLLEETLKIEGFEIDSAMFAKEAIERIEEIREGKREKPDLILLDLILPDMNGIEVLKELKKHPETKDIKIFAFTNYTDPEMNKQLIKEGVDKIILKAEISLKELCEMIRKEISQK